MNYKPFYAANSTDRVTALQVYPYFNIAQSIIIFWYIGINELGCFEYTVMLKDLLEGASSEHAFIITAYEPSLVHVYSYRVSFPFFDRSYSNKAGKYIRLI